MTRLRTLFAALVRTGVVLLVVLIVARIAGGTWLPWPGPSVLAFTPYAIPGAAVLLALALWLRRTVDAVVAGVSLGVLCILVVPGTVPRDQPAVAGPGEARPMRVMTANVKWARADPAVLVGLVRRLRPDVLSLQEATPAFVASLRRQGIDAPLPYRVVRSGEILDDTAVLSRWPVTRERRPLPSVYLPVRVELPGGPAVPFVAAHPTPPIRPGDQTRWRGWLRALPAPQGALGGGIVAGDFNATPDHGEFRRILGLGWRDAALEAGERLEPTWHGLPGARLTLDHVLVPPGAVVRDVRVDDLDGSDHRAVTATVLLPVRGVEPGAGPSQAGAGQGDHRAG